MARAVREEWPRELPLFVRISATDWVEGGWDVCQSILLARQLREIGVDLIDCSAGFLTPDADIPIGPGYPTLFVYWEKFEIGRKQILTLEFLATGSKC